MPRRRAPRRLRRLRWMRNDDDDEWYAFAWEYDDVNRTFFDCRMWYDTRDSRFHGIVRVVAPDGTEMPGYRYTSIKMEIAMDEIRRWLCGWMERNPEDGSGWTTPVFSFRQ